MIIKIINNILNQVWMMILKKITLNFSLIKKITLKFSLIIKKIKNKSNFEVIHIIPKRIWSICVMWNLVPGSK